MLQKSNITYKSFKFSWNWVWLALFSVGFAIFFIGMPKYLDDIRFMEYIYGWFDSQGVYDFNQGGDIFRYGIPWDKITDTWVHNWKWDNVRLGNIFVIIFLLFPKWFGGSICSLIWVYVMVASYRLAGIRVGKSPLVIVGLILWLIFLPWENWMDTLVFQFNYIIPTGLALWFLRKTGLYAGNNLQPVELTTGQKISIFLVSFILGWWNEAFSIPLLLSFSTLFLLKRDQRTWKTMLIMGGLLAGIVIIALAPGTVERVNGQVSFTPQEISVKIRNIFSNNIIFYLFILTTVCYGIKIGFKKIKNDIFLIFLLLNGFYNIVLSFATYTLPRVTWWCQIVSVIGIIYVLSRLSTRYWESYKWSNIWYLVPAAAVALLHLTMVDIAVCKIHRSFERAVNSYVAHPDKTVFSDVYTLKQYPLLAFDRPYVRFYGPYITIDVSKYIFTGKEKLFMIIPEELRNVTGRSGRELEGLPGIREFNDRLFIDASKIRLPQMSRLQLMVDFGKGYVGVGGYGYKFKSEADGRDYYYIHVSSPWYVQHFKRIKGLKIKSFENVEE